MKYVIVIIMFFADPLYQGNDAVEVETYNGMPLHFKTEQECSAHVNDNLEELKTFARFQFKNESSRVKQILCVKKQTEV